MLDPKKSVGQKKVRSQKVLVQKIMDLSFQEKKRFVNMLNGLQVTIIFVILENSGVFIETPCSLLANLLTCSLHSLLCTAWFNSGLLIYFLANLLPYLYSPLFDQLELTSGWPTGQPA